MRIVAMADTHLYHAELEVPEGDVLVHAGDLCRAGHARELGRALDWMRALPHPTKIVVAGNHDWAFVRERAWALERMGDLVYLEDSGAEVGGVRFWGSPWQPEFFDWAFNLPRGAPLAEKWSRISEGTDVLVTHGPPAGIGDRARPGAGEGCADLMARVRALSPRLHLFGHIHEDGGGWQVGPTYFANVTTWECERAPTVIDLDPATGEVKPVRIPAAAPLRSHSR